MPNKETVLSMKNWKEVTMRHNCLAKFTGRKGQHFREIEH